MDSAERDKDRIAALRKAAGASRTGGGGYGASSSVIRLAPPPELAASRPPERDSASFSSSSRGDRGLESSDLKIRDLQQRVADAQNSLNTMESDRLQRPPSSSFVDSRGPAGAGSSKASSSDPRRYRAPELDVQDLGAGGRQQPTSELSATLAYQANASPGRQRLVADQESLKSELVSLMDADSKLNEQLRLEVEKRLRAEQRINVLERQLEERPSPEPLRPSHANHDMDTSERHRLETVIINLKSEIKGYAERMADMETAVEAEHRKRRLLEEPLKMLEVDLVDRLKGETTARKASQQMHAELQGKYAETVADKDRKCDAVEASYVALLDELRSKCQEEMAKRQQVEGLFKDYQSAAESKERKLAAACTAERRAREELEIRLLEGNEDIKSKDRAIVEKAGEVEEHLRARREMERVINDLRVEAKQAMDRFDAAVLEMRGSHAHALDLKAQEGRAFLEGAKKQEISMQRVYGELQQQVQREMLRRKEVEDDSVAIKDEVRHLLSAVERVQVKREANLLKQVMDTGHENNRLKADLRLVSQDLSSALVETGIPGIMAPSNPLELRLGLSRLEAQILHQ